MKVYTNLEQSKKLSEILPLESADMLIGNYVGKSGKVDGTNIHYFPKSETFGAPEIINAWSLGALMNLLPSEFTEKGKYSETSYKRDIHKYKLTENIDVYQIAYGNYHWHEDGSSSWSDMINTGEKENLIDAAFQMIVWLKENNKL